MLAIITTLSVPRFFFFKMARDVNKASDITIFSISIKEINFCYSKFVSNLDIQPFKRNLKVSGLPGLQSISSKYHFKYFAFKFNQYYFILCTGRFKIKDPNYRRTS